MSDSATFDACQGSSPRSGALPIRRGSEFACGTFAAVKNDDGPGHSVQERAHLRAEPESVNMLRKNARVIKKRVHVGIARAFRSAATGACGGGGER